MAMTRNIARTGMDGVFADEMDSTDYCEYDQALFRAYLRRRGVDEVLRLPLPPGQVTGVTSYDPDAAQPVPLNYLQQAHTIEFTLPAVRIYTIVQIALQHGGVTHSARWPRVSRKGSGRFRPMA